MIKFDNEFNIEWYCNECGRYLLTEDSKTYENKEICGYAICENCVKEMYGEKQFNELIQNTVG